jgi:hypothetical protein
VRVVSDTCEIHAANWYGLQGPDCGVIESIIGGVATVVTDGPIVLASAPAGTAAATDGDIDAVVSTAQARILGRVPVLDPAKTQVLGWPQPSPAAQAEGAVAVSWVTGTPSAWVPLPVNASGGVAPTTSLTAADISATTQPAALVDSVADPVAGTTVGVYLWSGAYLSSQTGTGTVGVRWISPTAGGALVATAPTTGRRIPLLAFTDSANGSTFQILNDTQDAGQAIAGRQIDPAAPADKAALVWDNAASLWKPSLIDWSSISGTPPAASVEWSSVLNKPTTFTPSAHTHTMGGDVTGQSDAASVAKLRGKELASAVGTVDGTSSARLFLWWDKTNQRWAPFDFWNTSAVTGWVNCYDSAATDGNAKMNGVMAGTACSVFGRSANTDGLPASIAASADNRVLMRVSGSLSFAQVTNNCIADETITGGKIAPLTITDLRLADYTVTGAKINPDIILGRDISPGRLRIRNATFIDAIDIQTTMITAAGRKMSVREVDVCDAGTAKKMLILASAPY